MPTGAITSSTAAIRKTTLLSAPPAIPVSSPEITTALGVPIPSSTIRGAIGRPSSPTTNSCCENTTWCGAAAYAKYQFNDWFSLSSRGEYLHGNNYEKIGNSMDYNLSTGVDPNNQSGMDLWEYTITAGFNVIDNLLIRAEYRLDWGNNSVYGTTDTGGTGNQTVVDSTSNGPAHYAGAEVVYSF
ncbi:MAG: hypothetical protein EBZ78_05020 [Verrucomicrobia bacterium]|nr:hypothetical protein [Verrucomicrobiota bacterium]